MDIGSAAFSPRRIAELASADDLFAEASGRGILSKMTVLCDIDGRPEVHDRLRPFRGGRPSGERIAANVRTLVSAGVRVELRATVTAVNVDHMLDAALFHKELGSVSSAMVAVNAVNSDEDILDPDLLPDPGKFARGLREILDKSGWEMNQVFPFNQFRSCVRPGSRRAVACGAPYGNTPTVDANGDVYACIYLVGMPQYRIGNVYDEGEFPYPDVVERMMETLRIENIEHCRDCAYRWVCVGGCPVGHLTIAANPSASDEVRMYQRDVRCRAVETMVEAILWRTAEEGSLLGDGPQPVPNC